MNLLERARADCSAILGDTQKGGASSLVLIDPEGHEFVVSGLVSDVNRKVTDSEGNEVWARSMEAAISMAALLAMPGVDGIPGEGWGAVVTGADGRERHCGVIGNAVDNVLGVYRLALWEKGEEDGGDQSVA